MMRRALGDLQAILLFSLMLLGSFGSWSMPTAADNGQGYCAPPVTTACGCTSCGCPAPSEPRQPACPTGETVFGDYCLPACPQGWDRYPGYPGVCLPPCHQGCPEAYDQVPLPYCPEGYHRDLSNPNDCVPDFDQPNYTGNCPPGLVLSPATEECVVDCPQGSYRSADGLCRSYYQDNCQPGLQHDPETGRCVPQGNWPRGNEWICLPQCPQGYVRDIDQPTRCLPPPNECRDGYERTGNSRCEPVCEPGTQRDPYGYCWPRECPEGSYTNLAGICQEMDCSPGYDPYRGTCLPACQEGYSRGQDGACLPPEQRCPQGTQNFGGQCMPDCSQGYQQDPVTGTCAPETRGCASGAELVSGQCQPLCEPGTIRNAYGACVPTGCPKGQEKVNGTCLPRCLPPLERDAKNRCVCPQGTETVNGKCRPLCLKGMTRSGSGECVCRQGFEFVGGLCVPLCKIGLIRDDLGNCVEPTCRDGQESFRGSCVKVCSQGFVRNTKGNCVCPKGTEIGPSGYCQQLQQSCPEGYRRNEVGECVRQGQSKRNCPKGYSYSKRYKTCLPDKNPLPEGQNPDQQFKKPELPQPGELQMKDPNSPLKMVPPGANNAVSDCPDGYVRNKKGKCVKPQ